jgi:3-hydroxyisobutyrate dehydrogenase
MLTTTIRIFSKRVGFVGLGAMGGPMTANLLKAGFDVKVFDTHRPAIDAAVAKGAKPANSL